MPSNRCIKDYKQHIKNNVEIDPATGCWNWSRVLTYKGYGLQSYHGKKTATHRVSYQEFVGPIPDDGSYHGTCVCHRCDNPRCVNPEHLFLGSMKENNDDKMRKGRENASKGSNNGCAKLTEPLVSEIRAKYANGGHSHKSLADDYDVHHTAIGQLLRRQTWRHV